MNTVLKNNGKGEALSDFLSRASVSSVKEEINQGQALVNTLKGAIKNYADARLVFIQVIEQVVTMRDSEVTRQVLALFEPYPEIALKMRAYVKYIDAINGVFMPYASVLEVIKAQEVKALELAAKKQAENKAKTLAKKETLNYWQAQVLSLSEKLKEAQEKVKEYSPMEDAEVKA